jgi:UDP-N-acetylmuramyl tripeptide synthase
MIAGTALAPLLSLRPSSFADWRARLDREQIAPVIAIAGSRGKTSVLRSVESIFKAGGLRSATWTNRGVEIEGEGQRGELGPWSRALTRLNAGGLDVALRELDWATVQAIGSPDRNYPIVAVTNLCGNSEACLATPETLLARKALNRLRLSVGASGKLILNANDFDVSEISAQETAGRILVGISPDAPPLRRHLLRDGDACWVEQSELVALEAGQTLPIVNLTDLTWARDGNIPFAVQNALMAAAIARACGISAEVIAAGLAAHVPRPESMPGSFNVFDNGNSTIVIDRPMPSWFLRSCLRATANLGLGRQIRIVGPMENVATDDLAEVGRLLGRHNGVVIMHGPWEAERLTLFRQGAAANEVPPIFLQATDERRAIQQGIEMLRSDDVLLILAENAPAAVRLVTSRIRRRSTIESRSVGVA